MAGVPRAGVRLAAAFGIAGGAALAGALAAARPLAAQVTPEPPSTEPPGTEIAGAARTPPQLWGAVVLSGSLAPRVQLSALGIYASRVDLRGGAVDLAVATAPWLSLSGGYGYVELAPAGLTLAEHLFRAAATPTLRRSRLRLADRSLLELGVVNAPQHMLRYRNRVRADWALHDGPTTAALFAHGELLYDLRRGVYAQNRVAGGLAVRTRVGPFGEAYFLRQHTPRGTSTNVIGLTAGWRLGSR